MRLMNINRKALLALAIVFAFVAVVVPTCQMVGCSMNSGAASWSHNMGGLGFFGDCGGTWITTVAPAAAVPPSTYSLILALIAAVIAAVVLAQPPVAVERIRVHGSDPPLLSEDPRGERLRI